jgi:hypothetical protein
MPESTTFTIPLQRFFLGLNAANRQRCFVRNCRRAGSHNYDE